jgi:hypothetical protein
MKSRMLFVTFCALSALAAGSQAYAGTWSSPKQPGTNCSGVLLCAEVPYYPGMNPQRKSDDKRWNNGRMKDNDWRMKDNDWRMKDGDWRMKNRPPMGPYGWQGPRSTGTPY